MSDLGKSTDWQKSTPGLEDKSFVGVTVIMPKKVTHRLVVLELFEKRSSHLNAGWGFFSAATGFWIAYCTLASLQNPLALTACCILSGLALWSFFRVCVANAEMRLGTTEFDAARLYPALGDFELKQGQKEQLPKHLKLWLWIGRRLKISP